MFEKYKENRRLVDETMEKVLVLLDDTNKWIVNKIDYKHKDKDLSLKWGIECDYGGVSTYNYISSPIFMRVPRRYRKKFQQKITRIDNRDYKNNDLGF